MRPDLEQAINYFKVSKFGNKHNIGRIERHLSSQEAVIYANGGNAVVNHKAVSHVKGGSVIVEASLDGELKAQGVLVVTTSQVVFSGQSGKALYFCGLADVFYVGIETKLLLKGNIVVDAPQFKVSLPITHSAKIIPELQLKLEKAVEEAKRAAQQPTLQGQLPQSFDDVPAQIKKLSELKESGILTEQEFETKKSELLARM